MNIHVSADVMRATTKCQKDFSCLDGKNRTCCEITDCVNNEVIFVKCKHSPSCPYQQRFGNEFVCNCPIRKEIYIKHKI